MLFLDTLTHINFTHLTCVGGVRDSQYITWVQKDNLHNYSERMLGARLT